MWNLSEKAKVSLLNTNDFLFLFLVNSKLAQTFSIQTLLKQINFCELHLKSQLSRTEMTLQKNKGWKTYKQNN